MASGLDSFVNHTVSIITSDGRNFIGTLKGFDQTINIILDESHERVYSTTTGVEQVMLGLHIIRGDNVALIGLIDEEIDNRLNLANIKAEPLNPVVHYSSDVRRQCWHPEEVAVLTSRMILQDLLPDLSVLEVEDNSVAADIVEYFRMMIDVVQKSTQGRIRHITMLALTDLIGGYLQHAVLPSARQAYYAGLIDFENVEKLMQLYEEIKWYLRTNGQGWARPMHVKTKFEIQPIDLSGEGGGKGNKTCCRNLIYYQKPTVKRSADAVSTSLHFPIPFFDTKVHPSAIAVPFRKYALRNIESKRAAYVVVKYYIAAQNCLRDLHADKPVVENFQNSLYAWIEKDVVPKLVDDKFYAAFGGILRVEDSLKQLGAQMMTAVQTECDNEGDQEVGAVPGGEPPSRSNIMLIVMIVIIVLWFVFGTLFICYRIRRNSKKIRAGSFDTCKCTTVTEKSQEASSMSSEFDKIYKEEETKHTKKSRSFKFSTKSASKQDKNYCACDEPATIDHKHSMKVLPSIPEMSENSSRREDWTSQQQQSNNKQRKITFDAPLATSSVDDVREAKKKVVAPKMRVCVPRMGDIHLGEDVDLTICPAYEDKATSLSSSRSKSSNEKDLGTQMSDRGVHESVQMPDYDNSKQAKSDGNVTEDTTDNTGFTPNSPHIYACHSSLTGNYTADQRFQKEKPFIFGYDFQTSSSSELSDEDSDARTSTTK
ncbi:hypothetical protein NQ315_002285 [Exocentrus adspersus]|uniref:U6 snRNA-associated Sm-like protein LSm8 n=1 Tax=Exocentrus adspersus TaxID=1586481 RepID=A0AAV8VS88_9CUCU|nr:hypothetical protein NQ315_002285 [Exocentrus adspersus]